MSESIWITKREGKRGLRHIVRWTEPGSRTIRSKTFRRLVDARDYQAKLRRDIQNHEYFTPVSISYREWVERHLEDMRTSSDIEVSPKTIEGHKEALDVLGEVCNPQGPLEVSPKMIREFRRRRLEKNCHPQTINKHIAAIRSALSYAVRAEIIPNNKLLGPHRLFLPVEDKPPRILEVGEVTALLNVATELQQKTAISIVYYHGLRRGQLSRLRWEDIDLEEYKLRIVRKPRSKTRVTRVVALRRETGVLLSQLKAQRVNEYVFENPKTFYWACGKWFEQLVEEAGLDHCSIHDFRKTCNTLMKDAGVSQEAAMQVLGHSTVAVNQKYYRSTILDR